MKQQRGTFRASWQQHCQVHLMRNILGQCNTRHPRRGGEAPVKLVLQAPDLVEDDAAWQNSPSASPRAPPKRWPASKRSSEDAMAVMVLPEKYRKRLRTTNMQER
ncbi:MAG: transposase [Dechloromonas sp.]|nr:transposase [Candidatus Dechloromonas phosphoritropha]